MQANASLCCDLYKILFKQNDVSKMMNWEAVGPHSSKETSSK